MFQVGDRVRWTTPVGVQFAGVVRWIPPGHPEILHITCDPKRCSVPDWGEWHSSHESALEYDDLTLF